MKIRRNNQLRKCSFLTLYISIVVIVSLTLISSTTLAAATQEALVIDESYPGSKLVIASKGLHTKIKLVQPKLVPRGKFLLGQVSVQNNINKRLSLKYKFDWFDQDGFLIGDGGIWQRFPLEGHQISHFKSLGKNSKAASMQFTVRYVNDATIDRKSRK